MPFCLPTQVVAKLPISRFKDITSTVYDSTDFKLQKRKKSFRTYNKLLYRIVTNHRNAGSRYLIARDNNLDQLYRNEWHYISHELPALIPPGLNESDRTLWVIAHFTKLALEQKALSVRTQRRMSIDSTMDMNSYIDNNSPPNSPHNNNLINNDNSIYQSQLQRTASLGERGVSVGSTHGSGDNTLFNNNSSHTQRFNSTHMFNVADNVSFASPVLLPSVPIIPPLQHPDCNICTHNYNLRLSLLHLPNNDDENYHSSINTNITTNYNNSNNNENSINRSVQLSPTPVSDYNTIRQRRSSSNIPSTMADNINNKNKNLAKPQFRYKSISEENSSINYIIQYLPYIIIILVNCAIIAMMTDIRAFIILLLLLNITAFYSVYHYKPELLKLHELNNNSANNLPPYQPPSYESTNSNRASATNTTSSTVQNIQRNNNKPTYTAPNNYGRGSHGRSQTTLASPAGARFTNNTNSTQQPPHSPLSPSIPYGAANTPRQFTNNSKALQLPVHNRSQSDMDEVNYNAMANSLNPPSTNLRHDRSVGSSHIPQHKLSSTAETDETDDDDQPAIIRHGQPPAYSDDDTNGNNNISDCDNDADHEISHSHNTNKHRHKSDDTTDHQNHTLPTNHNTSHNSTNKKQTNIDKLIPGKSLHRLPDNVSITDASNAWTTLDATTFNVRKGPNYAQNKQKAKSNPSLFDLQAVDFYATSHKVHNIAQYVQLPGSHNDDQKSPHQCDKSDCSVIPYLPPTFVVHWLIPGYGVENPVWGKKIDDGNGHSLVLYYTLSEASKQMLTSACTHHDHTDDKHEYTCWCQPDESKLSPALQLLHRYVNDEDNHELRKRFKSICRLVNVDDVGLGGMAAKLVHQYNGTPFLIRTTSTFYSGDHMSYFEIDVDTHRFSYPARLGLSGIREHIKQVISDFAFLIEGQTDNELPEQILSAVRLIKLDFQQAVQLPQKYMNDTM